MYFAQILYLAVSVGGSPSISFLEMVMEVSAPKCIILLVNGTVYMVIIF